MVSQLLPQEEIEERCRGKRKNSLLYSQLLETGGKAYHAGSWENYRVVKRQQDGKVLAMAFIGISTGKAGQNRE